MPNFASIATYPSEVDKIICYGASTSESTVRRAFSSLINAYAHPRDLLLVEELDYFNPRRRKTVRPDGTLKNALRLDYGFWESKDTGDNLHDEIARKFDRGYPDSNTRHDNVTDWSLRQFQERYADTSLTKLDIFHYTYAVLHHPAYRVKYETNLKREFPRLPFYDDFRRWAGRGKTLMTLHLDYEQAVPFPFERQDRPTGLTRTQTDLLLDERNLPRRLSDDKPTLKPRFKAD